MVGNNTPIFFIRDPSKFPDFIHTQKRSPQTNLKDPDMFWDFLSLVPESNHQATILFSNRGTPDGYRHMHGFSSHTLKLVDKNNNVTFVKFHFKTKQGVRNLRNAEAVQICGDDADYATRDLFEAIAKGKFPQWDVCVQTMTPDEARTYPWNIYDVTKVWPQKKHPLQKIGLMTLNRNPDNYFAETEQAAFAPSHLVAGIDATEDKMLQGRLFSYNDTHRHRLGANFTQIPINRPLRAMNHQRDGLMAINGNGGSSPNYEPNSYSNLNCPGPAQPLKTTLNDQLAIARHPFQLASQDFVQAGDLYRLLSPEEKTDLVDNIAGHLRYAKRFIRERQVAIFKRCDPDYGSRVEKALAIQQM